MQAIITYEDALRLFEKLELIGNSLLFISSVSNPEVIVKEERYKPPFRIS